MILIKNRGDIPSVVKRIKEQQEISPGNLNILYVGSSLMIGGVEELFFTLRENLPEFNFFHLGMTDKREPRDYPDYHIAFSYKPSIQDCHDLFSAFDVVHLNNYDYEIWKDYNIPITKRNYKVIFTYRGSDKAKRIMNFKFDRMTCNRKEMADRYNYLTWFPVAFDIPEYTPEERQQNRREIREAYDIPEDDLLVVCVGRIVPSKRQSVVARAVLEVNNMGTPATVLFVGQHSYNNFSKKEVNNIKKVANGSPKVKIIGYQENPFRVMSAADLFVTGSKLEGVCRSINEAMALGIPVIAHQDLNNGIHIPGESYISYTNDNELPKRILEVPDPKITSRAKEITSALLIDNLIPYYRLFYNNLNSLPVTPRIHDKPKVCNVVSCVAFAGAEAGAARIAEFSPIDSDLVAESVREDSGGQAAEEWFKGVFNRIYYSRYKNMTKILLGYDVILFTYLSCGIHEEVLKSVLDRRKDCHSPLVIVLARTTLDYPLSGGRVNPETLINRYFGPPPAKISDYLMTFPERVRNWKSRYPWFRLYDLTPGARFLPKKDLVEDLRKKYCSDNKKIVMHVANIKGVKNQVESVRIAHELSKIRQDFKLMFVGGIQGTYVNSVRAEIKRLGVGKYIIFTDSVPIDEVYSYMSIADIFIHPSFHETYPNAVMEETLSNKPVLVRKAESGSLKRKDFAGFVEHVNRSCEQYTSPADAARKINDLLNKGAGNKGYRWVLQNREYYSCYQKINRNILDIIRKEYGYDVYTLVNDEIHRG